MPASDPKLFGDLAMDGRDSQEVHLESTGTCTVDPVRRNSPVRCRPSLCGRERSQNAAAVAAHDMKLRPAAGPRRRRPLKLSS